jgi:hypothetical protein
MIAVKSGVAPKQVVSEIEISYLSPFLPFQPHLLFSEIFFFGVLIITICEHCCVL